MSRTKNYHYKKGFSRLPSYILISLVVVMVFTLLSIKSNELKEQRAAYESRDKYLTEKIAEQEERSEEIEEYSKYMQTKQYIEDMAKEKLGLVYEDEIIFEADN